MVAKLSGNTSTASVAVVKARASVTVASPVFLTTAALPASEIAYILLFVSAQSDTTGRYRYIPEVTVISDAVNKAVAKAVKDSVTTGDKVSISSSIRLVDSVAFTETFLATLVFIRSFTDAVTMPDSLKSSTTKSLADALVSTDALRSTINKYLADGVAMIDSFSATDGLLYAFSKYLSNVIFVQDSVVVYPSKVFSDMIFTQDAGSLRSQGYCDFSYFAEDYVGESRTF